MKTTLLIAAATIGATLAADVDARPSKPSELRGYQACLDANAGDFRGLVPERSYLVHETDTTRTYYINATVWKDGERANIGLSCETSRQGRLISNRGAAYTFYVPASEPVQIAGQ